jgi:hypothetical protein
MSRVHWGFAPLILSSVCLLAVAAGPPPALASQAFRFEKAGLMGEAAPGTEPGTVFGPTDDVYVISLPAIDQAGTVSFVTRLQGPGVTSSNRTGVWSWQQGTLYRVARAGEPAPETSPRHSIAWDGSDQAGTLLPSGTYWARLEAGLAKRSISLVLVRH